MGTAILVLAAGKSNRMGSPKQLLKFGETTMLGTVVNNSLTSKANAVIVVIGAYAEEIKIGLPKTIQVVVNDEFETGLSSSIKKGVRRLLDFDSILIALGDQPFVSSSYFNEMMELGAKNPNKIIASEYIKHNGVPALFPKKFFKDLLRVSGDKGAKMLLNSDEYPVLILKSTVNLFDVDTPEDYNILDKNK
ncbi:nucleotidyltransferase family protein [Winogradskyella alexanderae]|uniref:Nucleotidyltransferase family protein n=1 Tax=Winogradskyella alexanderae TaxID=2877123 RepID=A0ABS7XPB0_9FLAO|nr:nucleotidyltransferase family protein [Winogradskyella alexanderae]MCA0131836.1 nucleotidyltransferase family protein [Winogradskyella alexanderae]